MNFTLAESSLSHSLAHQKESMDLELGKFKIGHKLALLAYIANKQLQGYTPRLS